METSESTPVEPKGRLDEKPAPVVVDYIYQPRLEKDAATLPYLTEANLAHVVMLARTGIIGQADARALLEVLVQIDRQGLDLQDLDPALEGLYYNYEQRVIATLGPRTGGKLHTGRSRNDLGATLSRMHVRDLILHLLGMVIDFRSALLRTAQEHLDTIITGYTHLQPAQPITMGHYLAAIEQALQRDTQRLFHTLANTNQSCMGAGALAGTGFPIDRQLVADLLGFNGFVVNSLDAVAGRDYLLELLSDLSILAITLSRLAQDLYVWYTYEFGIIDLPDRLGGTSSIMPQKKNPIIMETCQGSLSHILGGLVSALTAIKNTNYTNRLDANIESFHFLDESARQAEASLALLEAAVVGMEVRRDRAYEMAEANFSTVTELADTLVREKDYSFREAHHVVGAVVRRAMEEGLVATEITSPFIDEVMAAAGSAPVGLAEDQVRRALDPRRNVEARHHDGGPAPVAVSQSIDRAWDLVRRDGQQLEGARRKLVNTRETLRKIVREILA